ncbi:WD40-repeat-containing domain protein [Pyronema omphalodes]|nr:WD40-repeat-containing domain protein [Pyronema omphalodes]
MVKRKRGDVTGTTPSLLPSANVTPMHPDTIHLQIITGTYEKTLHGFIASIPPLSTDSSTGDISLPTTFTDTFLFSAHTSPLKTLALSPAAPNTKKRILATSSADERINLYNLSTYLPPISNSSLAPLSGRNRHLGTLHNHLNTPTALLFPPSRNKLISAGADGQIQILRTRDWGVLSTLKVPKPNPKPINYAKDYGEGYGPRVPTFGSEGYGGGAGAVNDIALHPSQKILLSVGSGERAVRMWNLMTARKAGVLAFDRETVPSKFGNEGQHIEFSGDGESYAVAFERGVVVFGMDSRPRVRIETKPRATKIHMIRFVTLPKQLLGQEEEEVLVVTTEDGRVLFFSPNAASVDEPKLLGTLGGRRMGMMGRVKDFSVVQTGGRVFVITAGSDGVVRIFDLCGEGSGIEVEEGETETAKKIGDKPTEEVKVPGDRQVGKIVGIYETTRRITCMVTMVMEEGQEVEQEDEEMGEAGQEEESSEEESTDEEDDE